MQKYKFRKLKKEDEKELFELFRIAPMSRSDRKPFLSVKIALKDKNFHGLVLVEEKTGKIVCYGAIIFGIGGIYDGFVGEVQEVATHPKHKKLGLARKLSEELLRIAEKKKIYGEKINFARLTCGQEREGAFHLYKSLGFEVDDTRFMVKKM